MGATSWQQKKKKTPYQPFVKKHKGRYLLALSPLLYYIWHGVVVVDTECLLG